MESEYLLEVSKRLAKPCIYLSIIPNGNAPVGWIKADQPAQSVFQWMLVNRSVFDVDVPIPHQQLLIIRDGPNYRIGDPNTIEISESTPLYAEEALSLASIEAVFLADDPAIQSWLADNNWEPDCYFNNNFKDRKTVHAFERIWQKNHPIYADDRSVVAIVGGWHFFWPDDDWYEKINQHLLLWTVQTFEPWVELWLNPATHQVYLEERIT